MERLRVGLAEVVDARVFVDEDVCEHAERGIDDHELGEFARDREVVCARPPHAERFLGTGLGLVPCAKASK